MMHFASSFDWTIPFHRRKESSSLFTRRSSASSSSKHEIGARKRMACASSKYGYHAARYVYKEDNHGVSTCASIRKGTPALQSEREQREEEREDKGGTVEECQESRERRTHRSPRPAHIIDHPFAAHILRRTCPLCTQSRRRQLAHSHSARAWGAKNGICYAPHFSITSMYSCTPTVRRRERTTSSSEGS